MEYIDGKRVWLITDTHLGVRSNSREWMESIEGYFNDFLIPIIQENYRPGDILIHCGDIFESRQSINLYVLNKALDIFEKLSSILPVYMIIGNHDIFMKYSNDVNSLKIFKKFQNITVYEEPTKAMIGNTPVVFMPWLDTHEQEAEVLAKHDGEILFCHTDVRGFSFNRIQKIDTGNDVESFNKFRRVYSGHIHFSQKYKNVRMLGSPYELTRSDSGNAKSIWMLDLETDEETQWENTYSPRYLKMKLEKVLEYTIGDLQEMFCNNYVDILVDSSWSMKFPFSQFIEKFTDYRKINYIVTTASENEEEEHDEDATDEINLLQLISEHVASLPYGDGVKERLLSVSTRVYNEVNKIMEEKRSYEN
jgi:DNA repair exonuclease SbcCD nuclease subunit